MRILSVTAQKPSSTGSGVYLTEIVKELDKRGHEQAVIAGVYEEDCVLFPSQVQFSPVYFNTDYLPFPIVGMSDEMPYKSTRYCDMTKEMGEAFEESFLKVLHQVMETFKPDLILCHHLYFLTAIVREKFPNHRVYGFCHNTDLRQLKKTEFVRQYILDNICKLDHIFVPQRAQLEEVVSIFKEDEKRITTLGMGYNKDIFSMTPEQSRQTDVLSLVFAGKIAEKKGVASLLKSLCYLPYEPNQLVLRLAGSAGNEVEYEWIQELAEKAPYKVEFLGRLSQEELAMVYRKSHIFVLPSFFDGLPLVVIEALACGNKVVVTDLPGVKDWIAKSVPKAPVCYVSLPKMHNIDEPIEEELPYFEKELARQIVACEKMPYEEVDLSRLSWGSICEKILEIS